jgi:peptide/nickel transport system permease protein
VLSEAGLSFLGLGIQPPAASWGQMIREGARYMLTAPHLLIFSGLTLVATVVVINLLGDRLRDHWDIKR